MVEKLVKQLAAGIQKQDFLRPLIGVHALTGYDTKSAFAGKGKWKALKLPLKNKSYVTAMIIIKASCFEGHLSGSHLERSSFTSIRNSITTLSWVENK